MLITNVNIFNTMFTYNKHKKKKNQFEQILVFAANLIWPLASFSRTSYFVSLSLSVTRSLSHTHTHTPIPFYSLVFAHHNTKLRLNNLNLPAALLTG